MIYSYEIITPPNTTIQNQKITELKLTTGIIHQVDVLFPPGPTGLLYTAIFYEGTKIWPSNPDEYFHTDNDIITFREAFRIKSAPNILKVKTYNIDDTYEHRVIIRLGILRRSEITGRWGRWNVEDLR